MKRVRKLKFIDLSVPIAPPPAEVPKEYEALFKLLSADITYVNHERGAEEMLENFPGITKEDLPEGLGWAHESIRLDTHTGTHLDAPWHYSPTSECKPAKTIDQVPLEWCYGDGVVLDMRHKKPGELISISDVKEALKNINYKIKPGDIVFIMTGTDKSWDKIEYWTKYPGMSKEATLWIAKQGVKVMGTDAPGWDPPFRAEVEMFKKTGDRSVIWGGHFAGKIKEYCHIEKLANLDKLPPYGFKVACFPVKIAKASAAWVRPVAIIEESISSIRLRKSLPRARNNI